MKISTKGRYALHVLLDLAVHSDDGYISLKDIAMRNDLSIKYLEMIVAILNKAGYVKSVRGKLGGYMLKKNPEDIFMADVLRCTEGSLAPVACLDTPGECNKEAHCKTLPLWKKLDSIIEDYLQSISLKDLMEQNI